MIDSAVAVTTQAGTDDGLSFLDAQRVLAGFDGGPPLPFLFAMAGTADPFRVYLEAACARKRRTAAPRFLPFGTLGQFLSSEAVPIDAECFVLFPWDFAPELDWRSGVPRDRAETRDILARAETIGAALVRRGSPVFYIPAATPPVTGHPSSDAELRLRLDAVAAACGAVFLPSAAFSLSGYFASGCPVGGAWLGRVAVRVVAALTETALPPGKLLVTDLDNTLWGGVLAEVGPEGIAFEPAGAGFRHHVYQSLLSRLQREGTLLAAATRNDQAIVDSALESGAMPLSARDFVAVRASYEAKSGQIRDLAERLNISLDAVVFVDDNAIELEEVRTSLPQVRVLAFPSRDEALPPFLDTLAGAFGHREVTTEDRQRTELYRRRADGMAPSTAAGADLTAFLASLAMRLDFHDRSHGDRARAVQLINKTNQFNANGRRWSDEEIAALLDGGGRLVTVSLSDRTGSHGEIAACLMDPVGVVEAMVLSCRVFQRRVEHAFLATLIERGEPVTAVRFSITARNEPFRQFISDDAFAATRDGLLSFDAARWADRHRSSVELFERHWD
jgi:FkbH-like protein